VTSFLARASGILLGLVLGAALLQVLLPRARAREDRARLNETRASCEVLLIGPSYANMVVPKDFEAEARALGHETKFCNLGRAGLAGPELAQEVEFALSEPWPKLQLVLVDVTLGRKPAFPEGNWFKQRTVEWHNLAGMRWLRDYYRDYPKRSPPLREWVSHGEHFLAHYVSLGRAPELFGWREPIKVLTAPRAVGADPPKKKKRQARREASKAKAAAAESRPGGKSSKNRSRKARKKDSAAPKEPVADAHLSRKDRQGLAATAELVAWNREHARHPTYGESKWLYSLREPIRRRGYASMFVIAPVWYHPGPPADSAGKNPKLPFLRFNDPERFPELYVPEARGNTHHLSAAGRPVYSRIMARVLFARWKPAVVTRP
jgi:hypothetical protein